MSRLTASVVGGGMGGRLSLNALHASDRFDLVAAADLRPDVCAALEREYPGLRAFADHRAMFEACPTDVVCVSTYPPTHEEVALDALKLPLKGILVEKPLGHTAASGRRIVEAVKEKGLPLAVPHGMLAKRTPVEVIERVRAGDIGELKLIEIQCRGWDIINAGIHWLDFCVTVTGNEPVASVMALCDSSARTYRDGMQVETEAVTYVQTESGRRIVMHTGDHVPINRDGRQFLFRLVGTAGQIEFWGWDPDYWVQDATNPSGTHVTPEEYDVTGHRRHLERMADMVESGKADYSVAEGSLMALEICEAAFLSSEHRCRVDFPLTTFTPPAPTDWRPGQPYAGSGGGRDGRKI